MRSMCQALFALCALLLAAATAAAHGGLVLPQEIHTREALTEDSYVLYGRGGNVGFVVGRDGVLVIDDQFADIAPGIVENIRAVTDKPIRYLINTHHHGDHTGGNVVFVKMSLIVAHHDVRKYMLEAAAEDPSVSVEEVPAPHLTYSREVRVHLGDKEIRIFHVGRGHTSGDSVVYFPEDGVLHMGDLFFHKLHPFIDVAHGGSTKEWIATLDAVLGTVPAETRVIPGHGPVTTMAELARFKGYLEALRREVAAAIAAGQTKEQAQASVRLAGYEDYEPVGSFTSLAGNVGIVYDEIRSGN